MSAELTLAWNRLAAALEARGWTVEVERAPFRTTVRALGRGVSAEVSAVSPVDAVRGLAHALEGRS